MEIEELRSTDSHTLVCEGIYSSDMNMFKSATLRNTGLAQIAVCHGLKACHIVIFKYVCWQCQQMYLINFRPIQVFVKLIRTMFGVFMRSFLATDRSLKSIKGFGKTFQNLDRNTETGASVYHTVHSTLRLSCDPQQCMSTMFVLHNNCHTTSYRDSQ